ncbi:hypothetical protein V6N11_055076 [Hibiscus sabdariffa]|uniref:Uncharacterized protein n=1 Tax=Hibiscus sabdariffa TaxID=183260 RepID=A0ABR1ZPZ0_9ROSI
MQLAILYHITERSVREGRTEQYDRARAPLSLVRKAIFRVLRRASPAGTNEGTLFFGERNPVPFTAPWASGMLLAKLLALDLPLEHEGRIHKAIDHEGLPMALYLPLSAGAYFDKLQDQRLDQLELQKAMAMELKWILSKVLDQPAILPMPRAPIDSLENRSS